MEFNKLYMFNPFTIQKADSNQIAETYINLQKELIDNADTGFNIAKNNELRQKLEDESGEMYIKIPNLYCPMCGRKLKEDKQ